MVHAHVQCLLAVRGSYHVHHCQALGRFDVAACGDDFSLQTASESSASTGAEVYNARLQLCCISLARRGVNAHERMQDVLFERGGRVSFSDYHWFTPYPAADANATSAADASLQRDTDNFSTDRHHGAAGTDNEEQNQSWRGLSDADEVVTLNLPLLGVLGAIEKSAGRFRVLAEVAVKQFFDREINSGRFEGLFMRRCELRGECTCVPGGSTLAQTRVQPAD